MRGWPLEVGLWGQASNRPLLRLLKTVVVSVWEKAHVMRQVGIRKTSAVAVDMPKEAWTASKPEHVDSSGMSLAVTGGGVVACGRAAWFRLVRDAQPGAGRTAVYRLSNAACQGQCSGRCTTIVRARWARRAATLMIRVRIVAGRAVAQMPAASQSSSGSVVLWVIHEGAGPVKDLV